MDWTIGKKCVPGSGARRAGYAVGPVGRRPALGAALVLALLLGAAPAARAAVTFSMSDLTVANQAILPSSAPTAVISINASATDPDAGARTGDSLYVDLTNVRNFVASRDIAAVYLFRRHTSSLGQFTWRNLGLGSATDVPDPDGIYPVDNGTCLGWFGPPGLGGGGGTRLGDVSGTINFTPFINTLSFPANDTGNNAGADYFIVIQTSDALRHQAQFRVTARYTYRVQGTPATFTAVTTNTNTIGCEYYAQNMTDRSGYHGWSWGMVHLSGVDGNPFESGNVMGINTPYLLFGLNLAGRSGLTDSTTEWLTGLEMLFTNQGPSIFAGHVISTYADVTVWEDTNNDGIFQPTFELTSAGVAGTDRLVGPADVSGGPVGSMRAHNGGSMTRFIDGVGAGGGYQASERTIALDETVDGRLDFFVCLTTEPSHIWHVTVPQYGDIFNVDLNDNPLGTRSINFWYARQSGTDPITLQPKAVLDTIRVRPPDTFTLGDPEPVEMTIGMAINATPSPTGIIEADGFPAPIFNFNLADGIGLGRNESIEQIRVWFSGQGFKPSDIMPLTDDEFSGISLWWDNKLGGMAEGATDHLGQFDPPHGVSWLGQTQNGQALHSTTFTDTNIPLSTSSLSWYNGGDHSPWSPFNDTGPDYYVVLRPKGPIAMPPNDYDWQHFANHGHGTVGDSTSFSGGQPINARGPDLFICVRANGPKNASYGNNWWERGMDLGDQMIATLKDRNDITFTRTGINASPDQFPKTVTQTLGTLPLAYNVLTTANNHPISPYTKTAVVGINLIGPDRELFGAAGVWRTLDRIAAAADGSAAFTVSPRQPAVGDVVTVRGTAYYDGDHIVTALEGGAFLTSPPWVQETFAAATVSGRGGPTPLTGVAAAADNSAIFSATGHSLAIGEFAVIAGTANYNGLYVVTAVAGSTFRVAPRYTADRFAGATVTGMAGATRLESVADTAVQTTVFAAPGHALVLGEFASVAGASGYNGLYVVTDADPAVGTFALVPRYVEQAFVGATVTGVWDGTTPLESVATATDGSAVFAAPGHGLAVEEQVTIAGTPEYDGSYIVTEVDGATFQVAPRHVAETFGNVNGVLLTDIAFGTSGSARFVAPGHGLAVGDTATIGGTTKFGGNNYFYSGTYVVTGVFGDAFEVAPPCTPTPLSALALVNGVIALDSVASAANGSAIFTATAHGLSVGDEAVINGVGQYNGTYIVTSVPDVDTFQLVRSHLPQSLAGARVNTVIPVQSVASAATGHAVFTATGHGLLDGFVAIITGAGSYNGNYIAINVTADTFEVAPRYVAEQFATVNGTVPLVSVTAAPNGSATFNAPGHGLAVNSPVAISGTGNYDGNFIVTAVSGTTFRVAPASATADYADAWVNTTLQSAETYMGTANFTAPVRTFEVGEKVSISNTVNYNGVYAVTTVSGNTFRVGPFYVGEVFPTLNTTVAVTNVEDDGQGYAFITAAGHGLAAGGAAVIAGTTNYDGDYVALDVIGLGITVAPRYQAETFTNAAVGRRLTGVASDSSVFPNVAALTVAGGTYADGAPIVIGGSANYNGSFIVRSPVGSTFAVSPAFVAGTLAGTPRVNGSIVLTAVTNPGDGSARFTATAHGLVAGDEATISGITGALSVYHGVYVVTSVPDANTFDVVRRYVAEDFTNAVAGKALTTVALGTGGSALFTSAAHGFAVNNSVWIGGTTRYNGHYLVSQAAANTFQVGVSFVGAETNNANANGKLLTRVADAGDKSTLFTALAHGFSVGSVATVTGTVNYNGTYAVTAVTADTFQLGPRYVAETFTTAQVGTALTRVRPWVGTNPLLANFTAPSHGLEVGDYASFLNTSGYDYDYVVTQTPTDNDLQVSPRWVGDLTAGATVNGIRIKSVEDAGDGSVGIRTFAAHGMAVGTFATIQGTVNYNGEYVVTVAAGDYLQVARRCVTVVSGFLNGTALTSVTATADGRAWFVAPGHGLVAGRLATVTGTVSYNGLYIVAAVSGSSVQLAPRYHVTSFVGATVTWGATGTAPLESVADRLADGSAIFAAPGITFTTGSIVTISGTPSYNGTYTVTEINVNGVIGTFRVSPRRVAMELANVNDTPLESVSDLGGFTLFTAPGHGLANGDFATIGGTAYYDGYYLVTGVAGDTFQVRRGCQAQAFVGATVNAMPLLRATDFGDGSAVFHATGHGLSVNAVAVIAGTGGRYDGSHIVTAVFDADTFQVAPRCQPLAIAHAGINQVLIASVSDAGDRSAVFTSPGHGLAVGDFVTIEGTLSHNGFRVVTEVTSSTFRLSPRCFAPEVFAGATVNGVAVQRVDPDVDGSAVFTSPGHGLFNGYVARLSNATTFNGDYLATAVTADTFKLRLMVAAPARIQGLVVQVRDTGAANFDISDLIDPTIQHPRQNQSGGGCGIAVYIDNPIKGQQGVFDEHDIRMPMSAVPYIAGPPQLPMQVHLNFMPENVIRDPGNQLVGTGGSQDQATGPLPETGRVALGLSVAQATDAVFQNRDGTGVFNPATDAVWIDTNHSGAYEAGVIPTTDTGVSQGNDFFLVVQPTKYMDPGDDFTLQVYNVWYGADKLRTSRGSTHITTRFTTHRMRNQVVTNDVLTDETTAGLLTQPGTGPHPAIGMNVFDPTGAGRLQSLRVYVNPQGNYDPNHLFATLSGNAAGGLSLWNIASGANVPVQAGTWHNEASTSLVYHEVTVPPTPPVALNPGTVLKWFQVEEKVCWADNDRDGKWSVGDALWINTNTGIVAESAVRYNHGADIPLVATAANDGDYGVVLHHATYGFAYHDANNNGFFELFEDVYFLGPGRNTLGWYTDLVLAPQVAIPNNDTGANAGKDFEVRFRTNAYPPIFGTLGWTFSVPHQSIIYNTGPSSANRDLTTTTARLEVVPSIISNFTATRGAGRVTLAWDLPATPFQSVIIVRTPTAPPGVDEVPRLGVPYAVGQPLGNGTVVYMGSGTSFVDNGVVNGTRYYYWAFAGDRAPTGRGPEDMVQAMPWPVTPTEDSTPPGIVTNLVAVPGHNLVDFTWNDPLDLDLSDVIVVRSSTDYPVIRPANEADYAVGANLGDGVVVGIVAPGTQTFRDDGAPGAGVPAPANGTTYYYAFYTNDFFLNYSAPAFINCMPSDGSAAAPRSVTSFNLSVVIDAFGNHDVNLAWNWPVPVGTPETGLIIVRHFGSPITGVPSNGRLYRLGDLLGTGETGTVVAIVNGTAAVTHTDQDVLGGGTYYYAAFTFNPTLAYSAGAYSSQVVSSAVVTYQDLTAAGQTIEFNSDPTPVIGINMYDNGQGAVLSAVTVQFNRLGNNSIFDLADIDGNSTASGVALYRDTNGNGVFNPGVDQLVPFTVGSGWSRGRPAVYDRKMDTAILGTTNWQAVDGVPGIQTGIYYADTNNNGQRDPGEPIWRGAETYTDLGAVVLSGPPPADGTAGIQTGLFYYDLDGSNSYTDGESLWRDESWPRMLTMNLVSGLDVPDTDPGSRPDLFVVVRTSRTIRYGTQVQFAIPGTFGLTFFGEEAGVAGLTTNAISCRIPATLVNLVAGGQTIPVSSPSTPVIAMDLADTAQTVDSLLLDLLNVGGDFDITPSDFINYQSIDQIGPISFWRDVRPIAPSWLGGVITATAADGGRTSVRVAGTDFAALGVRVGDTIRRVQGAVTTTAAVTALQSSLAANDTLVFMGGLTGVGGDHSLDPGDQFTVETRFLVASSPVINVADASHYPTTGLLLLGRELIAYDGKDANNNLLGVVRGVQGTASAIAPHPVGEALRVIGLGADLAADLTAAATTVQLGFGQGARFPDPDNGYTAYVRIGNEIIGYRKRTGDQLLQCLRGTRGSDPIPHIAGMQVSDATVLALAADIGAGGSVIDLVHRPFAPAAETGIGHVTVGLEVISYTGVVRQANGWQLIGCVRGASGTTAAAHAAGDAVVQGRPGTFDLGTDSLVSLASLPASGMSIPLNIRNQRLSPMIDGIMDFFVTVNTSASASHNDDFQVRLAGGALDFSVPAASDSWRGITSTTLRVDAQDTTPPVITQVRTLDLNRNGMLDHVLVTFSEPIRDASLTGYISEAIAFLTDRWTIQGYTGVGIDPNGTTGMVDVENDNRLVLFFDERAINIPGGWFGDTGALVGLGTAGSTLADLNGNLLNGGAPYIAGTLVPLTVDGAAPVLVDAFSDRPLTAGGEIAAGTVFTLRFSEPVTSLDTLRIRTTDFRSSIDGIAPLANGFAGVDWADVTAGINPNGRVTLTFNQESTSGGQWAEDATLNLDPATISEGDIVDLVGFNALPAPAPVPIRGLGSVVVVSAETGDANNNGRIDFIRITFDRPVNDSTLAGYPGVDGKIAVAASGNHFQVLGRSQVMIDLNGPFDNDLPNNNVLYLVFGEGGAPDTGETPNLIIAGTTLRSLDGEYTRDYNAPTTDGAPPVMIDVVTYDRNDNGAVDMAVVVFSEPVDDATVAPADFTIGGMPVDTVLTGLAALAPAFPDAADDEVLVLQITVPANEVLGTEFKTVAYTNDNDGTDLADLLGNKAASDGNGGRWGNQLDAARPTIQSARTLTDSSIQVVFSENVLGVTTATLRTNGNALAFGNLVQTGARTYVWSDPAGGARWNTDATGAGPGDIDDSDGYRSTDSLGTARNITPNLSVLAGALSDASLNTNLVILNNPMTTDGVVPVLVAVTTLDALPATPDGRVDSALLVFSEPISEATLAAGNFRIGGVVGTTLDFGAVANDQAFTVRHGGVDGTELKALRYTAGTAADMNGNPLAGGDDLGLTRTDAAKPVVLAAATRSDRSVELRFSEPVAAPAAAALTANGGAITFATVDASANPLVLWSGASDAWNTDATGASAGTGTDAAGVNRAAIPNIQIAADAILDQAAAPNGIAALASAATVDGAPPVVTKLHSTVPAGSTFTFGQLVPVQVSFSERVAVTGGTPTLTIQVSSVTQRVLSYQSGNGTRTLLFNYVVAAGDNRRDPDFLDCPGTNSLALGSSSITDTAPTPNLAVLTLPAPGAEYVGDYGPLYGHKIQIDTVPPAILAVQTMDHDTIRVTFSELILNDTDQIQAALASLGISDGGAPEAVLTFDAASLDADNTVLTNTAASFSVVYLHMTNPAKRWNTDATGTSAGAGTDGDGVARTAIPKLVAAADVLEDMVGNKMAGVTFTGTTDGAPPVVLAGSYRNSADVDNARVSSLQVRFSEPVDLASLAGWTLDPNDLPLHTTFGPVTRPDGRTVVIAVTATGTATGVNTGGTEPTLDYDGTGSVRDRSPALNALAAFAAPLDLDDRAGPVLLAAELATPSIARLTFSEELDGATVDDLGGSDFAHSTSAVTAAADLNAWLNARVTLAPPLALADVTTIRFAADVANITDAGGNLRIHVADVNLDAYSNWVNITGPATDVMHRGNVAIDVPGLVDVGNAAPEDDLDNWNLYLVQGHGAERKPIADATSHLLTGPVAAPLAPEASLGDFTPDTHAADGVYEYTLVLEVVYNGSAPFYVYREIFIAKDVAEIGEVRDGPGEDIDFQQNSTQLVGNWSGITVPGVPTARYEVSYNTDKDNAPADPAEWIAAGPVGTSTYTIGGLGLADGATYYYWVRARDDSDNIIAVKGSDGVTVDLTAPAGTVVRNDAALWQVQNVAFGANWDAFVDPGSVDEDPDPDPITGSGVASYQMAVHRMDGAVADPLTDPQVSVGGFVNVGNVLAAELSVAAGTLNTLVHGGTYYAAVRAVDAVGNAGDPVYAATTVTVDLFAPVPTIVPDGEGGTEPAIYLELSNLTNLRAYWQPFTDDVSGPPAYDLTYQYRVVSGDAPTAWVSGRNLNVARTQFTSVKLADGRLLVAGGWTGTQTLASVEIFDPATGVWTLAAPMNTARMNASAVLLPDGRVVVGGGENATDCLTSIEVYTPAANSWFAAGNLGQKRTQATAVLVDESVWFMGGRAGDRDNPGLFLTSIESFTPAPDATPGVVINLTSLFPGMALSAARYGARTVTLVDGRIMVIAGETGTNTVSGAVDIYDPVAGTWSALALGTARGQFAVCHLPGTNQVLVMGGRVGSTILKSVEFFDGAGWSYLANMNTARYVSAAVWIEGASQVLVVGGYGTGGNIAACETYDPAIGTWTAAGPLTAPRGYHGLSVFDNGLVLAYGGLRNYAYNRACESSLYPYAITGWKQQASALLPGGYLEHTFDTNDVTPQHGRRYIVQVRATDDAGNTSDIFSSDAVLVDYTRPAATVVAPAGPASANPLVFNVTFTKYIYGFSSGDLTVTNGTANAFAGLEGTTFAVQIVPAADGPVTVTVNENTVADFVGNQNTASNTATVEYWNAAGPLCVVALGAGHTNPTRVYPIPFTATFSRAVTGFTGTTKIAVTNGKVTTAPATTNGGLTYSFMVTPNGEGEITVQVLAAAGKDAINNNSQASNVAAVVYDTVAPTAVMANLPANPTTDKTLNVTVGGAGVVAYTWKLDSAAESAVTPVATPITAGSLADGSHTLRVWGIDAAGNKQAVATTHTWVIDTTPPVAVLTNLPANPTNSSALNATVGGAGVATYTYSLDGAPESAPAAVAAPVAAAGLADGPHTLEVWGIDALGNKQVVPTEYTWTVDTVAPVAALFGTPANPTNVTSLSVTVGGAGVARYTYSLDGAPESASRAVAVLITATGLANGPHTLQVWGIDAAGNKQALPTEHVWTINTVPPVAELVAGAPANPTNSNGLNATVGGTDVAEYTYSLDGGTESAPTNIAVLIYADNLADGEHTLRVWGIDALGNKQAAPTVYTWTVDTVVPVATLTVLSGTPTFENPIRFRMDFTKDMADFAAGSLVVANGTVADFVAVSAKSYTFSVVPTVARGFEVVVTVTLPAGTAHDLAGNACAGVERKVNFFTEPPARVTLVPSAAAVPVGGTFTVGVYVKELSDAANGFRGGPLDLHYLQTRAKLHPELAFNYDGVFDPKALLSAAFTGSYTSGSVNQTAGHIDELGGATTADNLGEGELPGEAPQGVLYATIPFVATTPGAFTMNAAAAQSGLTLTPPVGNLPVQLVDYGAAITVQITTTATLSVVGTAVFSENGGTATVRATLAHAASENVTVNLAFAGTAVHGTDYTAPAAILIPAGGTTGTAVLTGIDNTTYTGNKTVVVSIGVIAPVAYQPGGAAVTLTLTDDDARGDLTGDGRVDYDDFIAFIGAYGNSVGQPYYNPLADLNQDGVVNYYDFVLFIGLYGTDYTVPGRGIVRSGMRAIDSTAAITLVAPAEVRQGETFTVEVFVRTYDSHGFGGGDFDVFFPSAQLEYSLPFVHGQIIQAPFTMITRGTLADGRIVDLGGGVVGQSGLGYTAPIRYAVLQFVAAEPGLATIQTAAGTYGLTTVGNGSIPAANTTFGSVSVNVVANSVPVADDLVVSTEVSTPVTCVLTASDADGDALQFTLPGQGTPGYPAHGTIALARDSASVVYTPAAGFVGNDRFTFTVDDGRATATGTVTVLVGGLTAQLTITSGTGPYDTFTYGRRAGASDAAVVNEDLPAAGPLPTGGEAYFQVAEGISTKLRHDFRPLATTTVWQLGVTVPAGETWRISWNGNGLPETGRAILAACDALWSPVGDTDDLRAAGGIDVVNATAQAATFRFIVLVSETVEATYNLSRGWNLVGVPIAPDADSAADFLADENLWAIYQWSETAGYTVPTGLQAGGGYWVYAIEDTTLTLAGMPWVGGTMLPAGWNLVAAGGTVAGQNPLSSWVWSAATMTYGKPGEGAAPATSGVWIYLTEDTAIWSSNR